MAGAARPFLQGRVYSDGVQFQLFDGMAFVTELVAFLLQDELADDPVVEVAVEALPIFDHFVDVAHREILLDELLVAVEAILLLELPLLRLGGRRRTQQDDNGAQEGRRDSRCVMSCTVGQHLSPIPGGSSVVESLPLRRNAPAVMHAELHHRIRILIHGFRDGCTWPSSSEMKILVS